MRLLPSTPQLNRKAIAAVGLKAAYPAISNSREAIDLCKNISAVSLPSSITVAEMPEYGIGFNFPGDSRVLLPNTPAINPGENATFAVTLFTTNSNVGKGAFMGGSGGSTYNWMLYVTGGTQRFAFYVRIGGGTYNADTGTIGSYIGVPVRLVGTYQSSASTRIKLYVNGALRASAAGASGSIATSVEAMIGSWDTAYYSGLLTDARIYHRVWSEEEVQNDYIDSANLYRVPTSNLFYYALGAAPGPSGTDRRNILLI